MSQEVEATGTEDLQCLSLRQLLTELRMRPNVSIKCEDYQGDSGAQATMMFGIAEEEGKGWYSIQFEDSYPILSVHDAELSSGNETASTVLTVLSVLPGESDFKYEDLVKFISQSTGIPESNVPFLAPDVPVMVKKGGWDDGYGFRFANKVSEDGCIE